jgi:hypothetical protein
LVHGLVDAESPTPTHLLAGLRQHDIPRGIARRPADPLEQDENRRRGPIAGERQCRHGDHLHEVSRE